MHLRPAELSDASSLAAISVEVWIGTYLREGVSGFFADYALNTLTTAHFEALLADKAHSIVVSQNRMGIDGFMRLDRTAAAPVDGCPGPELATLYVQPRHHGLGIGRALLDAALDLCREERAPGMWLATNSENSPAIGFYHAQGFATVGHTDFVIDDQAYRNDVFYKAL